MSADDLSGPPPAEEAWTAAVRDPGPFLLDVFFRIAGDLHVGPENGAAPGGRAARRVALPPAGLPCRLPGRAATADLVGREDALVAHYEALVRIARAHGAAAALARPFPCFAVSPALLSAAGTLATWPWSDTASEAAGVLKALSGAAKAPPGTVLLDDQDQGWALRIVGDGPAALLVEWDAEGPPPPGEGWRLEAGPLAAQAAAALDRLRGLHALLCHRLGRDFWS